MQIYSCKFCGKEFENYHKLGGHVIRCLDNPNYEKNLKNCNNLNKNNRVNHNDFKDKIINKPCQYCGKICKTQNSLTNHERLCKHNPDKVLSGFFNYNNNLKNNLLHGTNQYIKAKKLGLPKPQKSEEGLKSISKIWKGKHLSDKHKEKIREGTIKYIQSLKSNCKPRYSSKACKYIDNLNKQKGWNLQHAENGGEIQLYGYFLDGYDKDLNIAFEYDESRHYKDLKHNILTDNDIYRQNYLIEKLNCEFWRFNEKLNLLYKVN